VSACVCLQKPTLLLIDDLPGVVGLALNKLHMLMPGIPVEAKLHEGGTVFWSFASLIQDASSNKAAQAHAARKQQPAAAAAVTVAATPRSAAAAGAGVLPDAAAMAASVAEFRATMDDLQKQQQQQRDQQQQQPLQYGCSSPDAHLQGQL
jgi:hypothetical protein